MIPRPTTSPSAGAGSTGALPTAAVAGRGMTSSLAAHPTRRIPLIDLVAQYRAIKPEIDEVIEAVLARGQFILGPEVEVLEREVASYCGTRHAVGVASGTDALELVLCAYGIGPGDEVITSAFSFIAAAEAIVSVGAKPRFVDIEPATYTMDPTRLAGAITPKTKAIIPVHLFGHPCDMEPLMALARRHRVIVIEDCAQALGARDHGPRVGAWGHAGILSFYPSKNLGAYGDGGMVITNDEERAERIRLLRVHGSRGRYHHEVLGSNSRLDELQAAILRVKLRHLDEWNAARRHHAHTYAEAIQRHRLTQVTVPWERPAAEPVYSLYTIRVPDRDRVQQALESEGISTQVAYPSILPQQPALASFVTDGAAFPNAHEAARQVLSLPMYPELTLELIDVVVGRLANALGV